MATTTVPDAIARLRAIEEAGPPGDGVASFARLYREVTEGVNEQLAARSFAAPAFLERLDVNFVTLFFDAIDAAALTPPCAPQAWKPLFEARSSRSVVPLQFALAGMNAHINRDLPLALVSTSGQLGIELRSDSPEHADYLLVNGLLEQVETRVRTEYVPRKVGFVDRLLHRADRIDDVVAMWNVRRARDAAWTNAETLWSLRGNDHLRREFVDALDRMVGFASRGLLIPTENFVGKLVHRFGR